MLRKLPINAQRQALILFLSLGLPAGMSAAEKSGSEIAARAEKTPLPASPTEMFTKISESTRPQWRQFYRTSIIRCLDGRPQAALGLGAVSADLFLAAQARDAQQVRNLLQDEETIEKTLGLVAPMTRIRQRVAATAEKGDWPRVQEALRDLTALHRRYLREQKDEDLADLVHIGLWFRTMRICHAAAISKSLMEPELVISSPALVADLRNRFTAVSNPQTETNRCMRMLHNRLNSLNHLWGRVVPPADESARILRSAALLEDTFEELIEDAPQAAAAVSPASS